MKKKTPPKRKIKKPSNWENRVLTEPLGRGFGTGAGVKRIIESPEQLWQYFLEYAEWCKQESFEKFVGLAKGKPVYVKVKRALVFIGFEGYLCMRRIIADLSSYEKKADFDPIIKEIRQCCKLDMIQGGLAGFYHNNLVARIEGLKEKTDVTTNDEAITMPEIKVYNSGPPLLDDEAKVKSKKDGK